MLQGTLGISNLASFVIFLALNCEVTYEIALFEVFVSMVGKNCENAERQCLTVVNCLFH